MADPYLTCYTPTYKRPKLLQRCKQSVFRQRTNVEHVIIEDDIGLGWGVYTDIRNHANKCHGKYVTILSDDNELVGDDVVRLLWKFVQDTNYPPVVIWQGIINGTVCPWQKPGRPRLGYINLGNGVIRNDVWQLTADAWLQSVSGDFFYFDSLWERGYRFEWMKSVMWRANAVMEGQPEE